MIYKISPCLPAGRLTPLCLSMTGKRLPKRGKERENFAKEGERKERNIPPDYVKSQIN